MFLQRMVTAHDSLYHQDESGRSREAIRAVHPTVRRSNPSRGSFRGLLIGGCMTIQLKLNTWYQTRAGLLVKIVKICSDKHVVNPFMGNNKVDYFPDGKLNLAEESPVDLIREVSHIGVLMNIICEQDMVYTISGDKDCGTVARIQGPKADTMSIEYGGYTEDFETLLAAYLKHIRSYS